MAEDWAEHLGEARVVVDGAPQWAAYDGRTVTLGDGRTFPGTGATFLAPVAPSKIICVHLTYRSRLVEYQVSRMPAEPSYFMKPQTTLNGHNGELRRPRGAHFLNYEGEVAVVVGRRMHGVSEAEALDYVAGWAVANDVGLHDFRHADRGSMLRVKGQDGFLPIGPVVTPAGSFDPHDYTLRTRLNGAVVQETTSADLIWSGGLPTRRSVPADHARAGRHRAHRNARQLPADAAWRCSRGRGFGPRAISNRVVDWDVDLSGPGDQLEVSPNTLHVALAIPEDEAARRVAEGRLS